MSRQRATSANRRPSRRSLRRSNEGGYVLPLTALMLIPLLAFTAFAVDLGAWYAQSTKMQRAVDNAALAGVVWLPDQTAAKNAATAVLQSNGYTGQADFTFPSGGQQMKVSISRSGQQYFSQMFTGKPSLSRAATAEFNKPVPLGSPASSAGNIINDVSQCAQFQPTQTAPCGPQPMLWQAIQGPYEVHGNGDAYATLCRRGDSASQCAVSSNKPSSPRNPDYDPDGYDYAIDVPASAVGTPVTVQVWDAIETGRTIGTTASGSDCNRGAAPFNGSWPVSNFSAQNCQTGDSGPTDRNGIPMQYQIWQNDGSDLTVNFDSPLSGCELYIPRDTAANPTRVATYKNAWANVCTFTPTKAGIYPLRVKSSNITTGGSLVADSTSAAGWNSYALRATSSASGVRLYSMNTMSIWTNTPGSTARFYLAQIKAEHKGKKIVLDLFDPGDGQSGTYTLQVLAPPTSAPFNTPASGSPVVPPQYGQVIPATNVVDSCKANTSGSNSRGGGTLSNVTNCQVTTRNSSGQFYQDQWLRFEIQLSANYSCSTDCWWTIKYDFGSGSSPNDRTTWTLNVVGDPVHLVQ
jgi:hypothetical protein